MAVAAFHVTIDHDVIRSWAERRSACPATLQGDERPWPLKFELRTPDPDMVEIDWQRFFDDFDRSNFAFVYREAAPDGALDDLHEFVHRSSVPGLTAFSRSTVIERAL
jgi:hypothetical protein